jgi:monovalent cation:H+ antiporter-2, CPA2 family
MQSFNHEQFMLLIITLLGGATIITTSFKYLKIPTQIGFIFSGILIGPYGLQMVHDIPLSNLIGEMATILLMFCLGLEFSISKLKELKKDLWILGPLQVFGTTLISGAICYYVMKLTFTTSLLWGLFISLSSTALVFKQLKETRRDKSAYGSTSIAILLFQDMAVIPILLLLNFITPNGLNGVDLHLNIKAIIFDTVSLILIIIGLARYIIPMFLERIAQTQSRELFFYTVFLICFGVGYLSHANGLSYSIGAFVAGLIISESPYGKHALAEFSSLRDNFLGIYFIAIGMMLDPRFLYQHAFRIIAYSIVILIVKSLIIYAMMRLIKHPKRPSLMVSLILFQVGEFSFILASIAHNKGLIEQKDLQLFLSLSITTMIMTPIIYRWLPAITNYIFGSGFHQKPSQDYADTPIESQDLIILVGFGHVGQEIAKELRKNNSKFKIIESNYNRCQKFKNDWPIYFGDATNIPTLENLGAHAAKMAIITAHKSDMASVFVSNFKKFNPFMKILLRLNYVNEEKNYQGHDINLVSAEREVTQKLVKEVRYHLSPKNDLSSEDQENQAGVKI